MDPLSAELILQIVQGDLQDTLRQRQNSSQNGELRNFPSDQELALREWEAQLQQYLATLIDHQMAHSISNAVQDDGVAVTIAIEEERRALADRVTALRVEGHDVPNPEQLMVQENAAMAGLVGNPPTIVDAQGSFLDPGTSSSDCQLQEPAENWRRLPCASCAAVFPSPQLMEAPCGHIYCRGCATHLIEHSFVDESLFPPRCCRLAFPVSAVRQILGLDIANRYDEKSIERNDPYRTYCSNPQCAQYIFPAQVAFYVGTCNTCAQKTCTLCKKAEHPQCPCPAEDSEVLVLAEQEGWRRCPGCRNLVELKDGCNHITCRCRFEFCYICGTPWRRCRCELWDEERLVHRAQVLVGRDQPGPPPQAEVQRVARYLRQRESCDHEDDWTRLDGVYECEHCLEELPYFILLCPLCGIRACVRCKYNRF
ncbi:IBR domain protein [Aspergillus steynii IBT 23096]|uniref:RBR-type E3 ubiquitin transferase n=1 Tax=Aspergillus steynii IBT 23096 TaxID=1392250 RepID=A0A2I2GIK6_9EURO|nr:IBR domain protein [Aspergillus steynii IBT 23096]PLB52714.1 IBR domain protein [Aspergillus steynii IBT 23096]